MVQTTYNFQNMQIQELITEAYERCGGLASEMDANQKESAKRSINFMNVEWLNKGVNLYTIDKWMLEVNIGQPSYFMPPGFIDIDYLIMYNATRKLNGIAYSDAGGDANNAFDNDPNTACIQTSPNGYISYNFNTVQWPINFVGIRSNVTRDYTLNFEYSNGNDIWFPVMENSTETYYQGITKWFVLPASPLAYYWRVRETGGATLNIQEIYFDVMQNSILTNRISRGTYLSVADKTGLGSIPSYWLERTDEPVLNLYPVPNGQYQFLMFTFQRQAPDLTNYTQALRMPQRFLNACAADIAARVAEKFFKDQYAGLKMSADEAYNNASIADKEKVNIKILPGFRRYF